jgi:hypothetical protein
MTKVTTIESWWQDVSWFTDAPDNIEETSWNETSSMGKAVEMMKSANEK